MPPPPDLLAVSRLTKSYATIVLAEADFDLRRGEVHALVGENGAGKSTLAKIIAGIVPPDSGRLRLNGQAYVPRSRVEAEARGVRMVLQELNLIGNLTVAESILLGQWPRRAGWLDYRRLNAQARELLAQVGLGDLDPARPIHSLGIGQQQLVEIAAGLSRRSDVFILDEPTAALTDPEIELLFRQLEALKRRGVGLIYISHRLEEIQRIADRITVLRDGQIVGAHQAREVPLEEIVRLMVGRELGSACHRRHPIPGPVLLRVAGLCRGANVRQISFEARGGEILGFAGLMGSGRTETMRAIFGADQPEEGQVFLRGAATAARIRSPRDAVRQGIALLTEDRKEQGLLLPLPVRSNVTLAHLDALSRWGGWLSPRAERASATHWAGRLRLRCDSVEQPVLQLSGGNQQKVVLAKWLFRDCDILIFDEPTRGIDVGAKFEIYELLADLADKGKAVIVVSSDLMELLAICDRLIVLSAGEVAATFSRGEWTQDRIMAAALSGYVNPRRPPAVASS